MILLNPLRTSLNYFKQNISISVGGIRLNLTTLPRPGSAPVSVAFW